MPESKIHELWDELRTVLTGQNKILDSILPPLAFVVANALFGLQSAIWSALAAAGLFAIYRLARRQPLGYALGGLGVVVVAVLIALALNRAEGFFLPNILTGGLTVLVCVFSTVFGRPMVAWTSYVARRWPLDWYWHPRVRPAYSEVTLAWAVYFGLRLALQLSVYQGQSVGVLAVFNLLSGWPATVLLLIISYLYGTWRLRNLRGPSVEEFKNATPPPWQGQRRGF